MSTRVIWTPQPRQEVFMRTWHDEALYGGAAGGGKSDALVIEALRQVDKPYYKGLILRKTFTTMGELEDKTLNYYPRIFPGCRYNKSSHEWTFPSGAKIRFGHMQHTSSKLQYQGQAFDFIAFDELTQFQREEYMYMLSRNRSNGPGMRCYMRATGNPGGVGHGWVKERFITAIEPGNTIWEKVEIELPEGGKQSMWKSRIFIKSSIFDNPALLRNSPSYLASLAAMPYAERRALLYGDWDSFEGQVFMEWKNDPDHYLDRRWTHVIEPFDIPDHWPVYRSFDWGYAKPFSVGWWTVDEHGVLYRIGELYGCDGAPDVGVKWTVDKVMSEIYRNEHEHPWLRGKHVYGIADPAIWQSNGGPAIVETAERYYLDFEKGDHERLPGLMQMHYRLAFDEEGYPMMYVFKNCAAFIRTVPSLVYSQQHVEDVDTSQEDHVYDEARYMAMSRPIEARANVRDDGWEENPANLFLDADKNLMGRVRRGLIESR